MRKKGSSAADSIAKMKGIISCIDKGKATVADFEAATELGRAQVFNVLRHMKDLGVDIRNRRGQGYYIGDKGRGPFA